METIINKQYINQILKPVAPDAHKGTQGHVLIIGGSYGKIGAVCLASKAALRTGTGLVTAFIPECGYGIVQTAIPEVMALTDSNFKHLSNIGFEIKPNAIGIGPGMGQEPQTQNALYEFLRNNSAPLIIDADALNILAQHKDWLQLIAANTILTPHAKELERLIGTWSSEEEKIERASAFSKSYKIIIVAKGAQTKIISGDKVYVNATGNAGLATAGSGDVLTGIITSLAGQGYSALNAAILGVYLHGLAADIALPDIGIRSLIASDIIAHLAKAYFALEMTD